MSARPLLRGTVITSYEKRSHGVIELLAVRLRDRIALTYCQHPNELDPRTPARFIIVFSVADLANVIRVYDAYGEPLPLIIHIDSPEIIAQCNHAELFPGVDIAPITQAALHDKKTTLKIILFEDIIHHLDQISTPSGEPCQASQHR